MSYSQENKKKKELYIAGIFIEWLNVKEKFDYICKSHTVENSIVDVIAISESKRFPDIKIQVSTAEAIWEERFGKKLSAMRKHGDKGQSIGIRFNSQQWILESIKKKEERGSRNENKGDIILLLGVRACIRPQDIENKKILPAMSSFKEVYIVFEPTCQNKCDRPVVQLK